MQYLIILAIALGVANCRVVKREAGEQTPKVWDALSKLKGKHLDTTDVQILAAVAGTDFPTLAEIPPAEAVCDAAKPGFYANVASKCQAFDRCDVNGNITSYLCSNGTLFNQITLICDQWYNVDCEQSAAFKDYSNSRLYTDKPLLDNQDEVAAKPDAAAAPAAKGKGDAVAAKTGAIKASGAAASKGTSAKAPAKAAAAAKPAAKPAARAEPAAEPAPAEPAPAEPAAADAAAPAERR